MEINKENWNKFVLENQGSFLQSWEWGEFQENFGKKVFRFAADDFAAQFIANKIPGVYKFYWHCPRGPVMGIKNQESGIKDIIEEVKKTAGKEVIFFRLGPECILDCHSGLDPESRPGSRIKCGMTEELKKNGFKQLPYDIEPSQTLILDLNKSEEELLAQMHEKWRYNIRLAERKGVKVKMIFAQDSDFEKYFEEFYKLIDQGTSERKNIRHYPKEYYRQQLTINNQQLKFALFIAEYENKVIAANIVVLFGNKATYLHGATSSEHREVMAPHLLQWEQIKYAKAQGCSEYDFWGIVNEHTLDKRGKSWEGFTRFKKGFGGKEVNYVGYFDYPLNKPWYFLYRLVQKFRR